MGGVSTNTLGQCYTLLHCQGSKVTCSLSAANGLLIISQNSLLHLVTAEGACLTERGLS